MKLQHTIFSRKIVLFFFFNAFKFIVWLLPYYGRKLMVFIVKPFSSKISQPASTFVSQAPPGPGLTCSSPHPPTAATAVREDRWEPEAGGCESELSFHVSRRITVSSPRFSWSSRNALCKGLRGLVSPTLSTPWIACRSARDGRAARPQVRGRHGGSPPRYSLQLPEELSKYNTAHWRRGELNQPVWDLGPGVVLSVTNP